jgi:hypothetical protein
MEAEEEAKCHFEGRSSSNRVSKAFELKRGHSRCKCMIYVSKAPLSKRDTIGKFHVAQKKKIEGGLASALSLLRLLDSVDM